MKLPHHLELELRKLGVCPPKHTPIKIVDKTKEKDKPRSPFNENGEIEF